MTDQMARQIDGTTPRAAKPATPVTRGARRAAATRARLIRAAMEVMAEKGMDNVTIAEIAEAADVGVGSFYNHFGTREALQTAVLQEMIVEFGDAIDALHGELENPLEVMVIASRLAYRRARADKAWGMFLVRSSERGALISRGLGRRMRRDMELAQQQKLIHLHNVDHMAIAVAGTVMSFISAGLHGDLDDLSDDGDVAVAETMLAMMGVAPKAARAIVAKPVPEIGGKTDAGN